MILFTIYDLFTMKVYDGDGRKKTLDWCTSSDALVDVYLWSRASPLSREYNNRAFFLD